MSNLLTLRGTGKLAMVDGAEDSTDFTAGTKRIITFREITLDPQIERQQSRVEEIDGTLGVGDSYILFSHLRLSVRTNRLTAEVLAAFFSGTKSSAAADYYTITPQASGMKNRSGGMKLDFFHPELGATVPAIKADLLFYKGFAPDGTAQATPDGDSQFGFMWDWAGGNILLHEQFAAQFPAS